MKKYILRLIGLFSILNIFFCTEYLHIMGISATILQMCIITTMAVATFGCIISMENNKNNKWIMTYCLSLISLFSLIFKFKFSLIMLILSLVLYLPDETNKKQDC